MNYIGGLVEVWIDMNMRRKNMKQEEIKEWIDRWSKLKPSPKRDMVIKIWSRGLKRI